jgi:outer membrane protein assembly factor BamA
MRGLDSLSWNVKSVKLRFLLVLAGLTGSASAIADRMPGNHSVADTVILGLDTTDVRVLTLNRVLIIGNKVTRDPIILRELSLHTGDTVTAKRLQSVLTRDRNKIYNLRLFNSVTIRLLQLSGTSIDLLIEVNERWYTFPVPIFEFSDRNFNEWWQNYNHDFKRVNYGLRLYQYNFRGRNETLRLTAQFGFVKKFDLTYRIPYIDRNQKQGLTFSFDYAEPKNLAYYTEDHKLLFIEGRVTLKKTIGAGVSYSYRKSFYTTHGFNVEFRNTDVADTVIEKNPNYYLNGSKHQRFASLSYSFNTDHRDVQAYPLHGYQLTGFIEKNGLGLGGNVNQVLANFTLALHREIGKNLFLANYTSVLLSSPATQPYNLYTALGYRKQFIRGYEIYVIEGPKYFLNKTTLKKRIFSRVFHIDAMPMRQFRYFPLSIYLKGYLDLGYVENYPRYEEITINNRLSNRFLGGTGAGIDVVSFYDTVFRFEYTFTRENTNGFFFHIKKEF